MKNFLLMMGLVVLNCSSQQQFSKEIVHQPHVMNDKQEETPTQRRLAPLQERFEKFVEKRWEIEIEKYKTPKSVKYALGGIVVGLLTGLSSYLVTDVTQDREYIQGIGILVFAGSTLVYSMIPNYDRREAICAGKAELCTVLNNTLIVQKERIECDLKNENKSGNLARSKDGIAFLEHMESVITKFKDELNACQQHAHSE